MIHDDADTQIELIRTALWARKGHGASIMVGAGFSTNARPNTPDAPPFLVWWQIAEQMKAALRYPSNEAADALTLASEYCSAFGENALESLIRNAVPESYYDPSDLHRILLLLPWMDVLTTNYDQLLERTLPSVPESRYGVVRNAADIAAVGRPRIVKLHGSFPSYRPFVFTEEQYRHYPTTHAPFVNLVQQTIMESLLCLIGFSGDDPNFLKWIGWVRDHLGPNSPPVYLVGALDLTPSRAHRLRARQVIPVDLGPRFPTNSYPDRQLRHRAAVEWFLLSLANGEPLDRRKWPRSGKPPRPQAPSSGLPPLLPGSPSESQLTGAAKAVVGQNGSSERERILASIAQWCAERCRYPGWVALPEKTRTTFAGQVDDWRVESKVNEWLATLATFSLQQQLVAWRELVWRLEKALLPLVNPQCAAICEVLERVRPFGALHVSQGVKADDEVVSNWPESGPSLRTVDLADAWVENGFAVLRTAREEFDTSRFERWTAELEPIVGQRTEWSGRWHLEKALWALACLDIARLDAELTAWVPEPSLPLLRARRAALLGEVGRSEEARREVDAALSVIQATSAQPAPSLRAPSEEGWVTRLALSLGPAGSVDRQESQHRRLDRLSRDLCDPAPSIESLVHRVAEEVARRAMPDTEHESGFDPGAVSVIQRFVSYNPLPWAPLKLIDTAPLVAPQFDFETVDRAAQALFFEGERRYSMLWLIRSGRERSLADVLDRVTVATLDQPTIDAVGEWLLVGARSACDAILAKQASQDIARRIARTSIEALGRLFFRLKGDQRASVQSLLLSTYGREPFLIDRGFAGVHHAALRRAMLASFDTLADIVPGLIALPLADPGAPPWGWKEPTDELNRWVELPSLQIADPTLLSSGVSVLLAAARAGGPKRSRALSRLILLRRLNLLTSSLDMEFGTALWQQVGSDNLPSDFDLLPSALLDFPAPPGVDVRGTIQAYFLAVQVPNISAIHEGRRRFNSGAAREAGHVFDALRLATGGPLATEGPRVRLVWSTEQLDAITRKLEKWTDENDLAGAPDIDFVQEVAEDASMLVARVLLPLSSGESVLRLRLLDLLVRLGRGRSRLEVAPSGLLGSVTPSALADRLLTELHDTSGAEQGAWAVAKAIYLWLSYSNSNLVPPPPPDLVVEVSRLVAVQREPGLAQCLDLLSAMVRDFSAALDQRSLEFLGRALLSIARSTILPPSVPESLQVRREAKDRLEPRIRAARLAGLLNQRFGAVPPLAASLDVWARIAESDVLPEVRQAWANGNAARIRRPP